MHDAVGYWSEHSDRAGVDSWLGALSVGADLRRFVGRWAIQSSEDSYVRTAIRITENCQRFAARHAKAQFRGGPDFLGEEETLEQLRTYLTVLGHEDAAVAAQIDKLTVANNSLAPDPICSMSSVGVITDLTVPSDGPSESSAVVVEQPEVQAVAMEEDFQSSEEAPAELAPIADEKDIGPLLALQDAIDTSLPEGFVISKTKNGACRRLHFVGGCFRMPGEHYKCFESFGQAIPPDEAFNVRCKDCFPAGSLQALKDEEAAEISASDGSDSSGSSVDEASEGEP